MSDGHKNRCTFTDPKELSAMDDPILASYPPPGAVATKKELSHLDEHCASFVAMSPFVVVSTASASGAPDVSPRGGPPGFVRQVDDHTLLLPDRLGNNRLDSLRKIAENPRVALLFMVPGINDTLRVFGTAHLATTDQLATDLTERGRQPQSVLVITVELAFVHCAKALMRGKLWEPESYTPRTAWPTAGEVSRAHTNTDGPAEDDDTMLSRYRAEL